MATISETLRNGASNCALIAFITAGYPTFKCTLDALYTLDNKGADIIELGIPYSDALADGPIIQESSHIALQQGTYIDQVLNILKIAIPRLNTPIVIFTYYNPILARGIRQFLYDIASCGVKGLIIPDLPLEETDYLIKLCLQFQVELILFIAPTSSQVRINAILSKSPGCIYLISSTGVTGLRDHINPQIYQLVNEIKSKTDKLIMLGFGISKSTQVSTLAKWNIDGIVIGSAFIKSMSNKSENDAIKSLGDFCMSMKDAIDTTKH